MLRHDDTGETSPQAKLDRDKTTTTLGHSEVTRTRYAVGFFRSIVLFYTGITVKQLFWHNWVFYRAKR